jgi:hypothetical protein
MNPDHNKAMVQEFDDLGYGNGDLGRLDYLRPPDMGNHALAPGAKPGIEGPATSRARRDAHLARWLESQVVVEDDMVVQLGVRMTG